MIKKIVLSVALVCVVTIGGEAMALELKSPAFSNNEFIPKKFSCQGDNVSPALNWDGVPEGTQSIALICDDPDAPMGTWVHWVVYDLPPQARSFLEAVDDSETLADGAKQGKTDFGKVGYGGPCPPPGKPHRYFFKLYCLDTKLNLGAGIRKKDLERAMQGHILAEAQLIGLYKR